MRARSLMTLALAMAPAVGHPSEPQAAAPTSQASGTEFPTAVEIVNVDAVVLDKSGNPVEGLAQAAFSIREDGRPQTVTSFEAVGLAESPPQAPSPRARIATNQFPQERGERWFVVVFDDVNLSREATPRAQSAIVEFLTRGLRDGDQVMILPTSGGAWWTGRLPEDRDELVAFVKKQAGAWRPDTSAGRIWDYEAIAIANDRDKKLLGQVARRYFEANLIPESYPSADPATARDLDVSPGLPMIRAKATEVYTASTTRIRATLGSLARVSAALGQLKGRKTLLLVSEGFIMDPSQSEFRELIQVARNTNTVVNFVDARDPAGVVGQAGMPGGGAEYGTAALEQDATTLVALATLEGGGARSIALDTGGAVVTGSDLVKSMVKIARESRAYYLLGYTSTNTKRDGKFRKIEVSVARPDVNVHARRGYYAPSNAEARPVPKDKLDPVVRASLDAPLGAPGIPLRFTSYVLGREPGGKVQTLLVAEADLAPLHLNPRGGKYEASLDSYVVVHGRDNGAVEKQEALVELAVPAEAFPQVTRSGLPIRRTVALAPGVYQARLLLRDRATGLVGSVRHEFEVPAPSQFHVSTPVITDSFQAAEAGQAPRPVPIAHRTFRAGTRIACTFEVFGAAPDAAQGGPRVTLGYRLRRADGTDVAAAPPRLLNPGGLGQLAPLLVVELPAGGEGEHELVLDLRDEVSGTALEVVEPLTLSRQE